MGMQVPYCVCTKIQKKRNIWKIKKRYRCNIEGIMYLSCEKCGTPFHEYDVYCSGCGRKIMWNKHEEQLRCDRCGKEINYLIKYPMNYHLCTDCFQYMMSKKRPDERSIPLDDERMNF